MSFSLYKEQQMINFCIFNFLPVKQLNIFFLFYQAFLQFSAEEKPLNFHIYIGKHKNDQNNQVPASIIFHVWLKFFIPIIFIHFMFSSFVFYCFNLFLLEMVLQSGFKVLFSFCFQKKAILLQILKHTVKIIRCD